MAVVFLCKNALLLQRNYQCGQNSANFGKRASGWRRGLTVFLRRQIKRLKLIKQLKLFKPISS
jgi:hypothetical protein